jgi:uncharacterized protein YbjT (DUF2867 family)
MSCKVFVIGATGNIGRELVEQLARAGVCVRVGVRDPAKAAGLAAAGIEIAAADYDKADPLAFAMKGCEKVFFVNPLTHAMADQAAVVAQAAKRAGITHVVRSSGMGADAPSPTLLGRWHREAEKAIEASGIPYTHLRPNSFMQNFAHLHGHSIRARNAFYHPLGDGRTSYVDVRDIAGAAVAALTTPGHENKGYTLTGPAAISGGEAAEILSRVLDRPIAYVDVPEAAARKAMIQIGMPPIIVDALSQHLACMKEGLTAIVTTAVEAMTGRAAISFEKFAQDNAPAFQLLA